MAVSQTQLKQPDAAVIKRHDELVRILDWQPSPRGAVDNYWETDAKTFGDFTQAVIAELESAVAEAESQLPPRSQTGAQSAPPKN